MSFFKLLKKFFTIFGSKLDRTLNELDSIKDRSHRIKTGYESARIQLNKTREDVEGKLSIYEDRVKFATTELNNIENALLNAVALKAPDETLDEFNREIESSEQQLAVLQETLIMFQEQVADLDEEAKQLDEDIRQASNTLDLAEVRYQSAKDLIAINSSGIPDSLRLQIESVRKDADEMSARYKGVKRVKAKTAPSKDKLINKFSPTRMTTEQRIQALKDKAGA